MNEGDLGGDARAVLARGRSAHDPPADARARVRAKIEGVIAGSSSVPLPRGPATGARWGALGMGSIVLATVVVASVVVWRSGSRPGATSAAPNEVHSAIETTPAPSVAPGGSSDREGRERSPPPVDTVASARSIPASAPHPPTSHAPVPSSSPSSGSVAIEAALLRRADASLHAGDASGALAVVNEHARRFPTGVLAEERDMERIMALCALGRRGEAAAASAAFTHAFPSSSHVARIRQVCDEGSTP